ncbi:MAG: DUF1735 and LamG domain-containing protein [Alistipes sp.]
MKLNYLIASLALFAAATSCQEAAEYTPSIYIAEAQVEPSKTITIYEVGGKAKCSVASSVLVDKETHVSLEIRPELLEAYNTKYGKTCVLLDPDSYEFSKNEVTIAAGGNMSDAAEISITKALAPGTFYCLPIQISKSDGSLTILEPSRTLYMIFRVPVKSKAVFIGYSNKCIVPGFHITPKMGDVDLAALPELTLECRVQVQNFQKSDPYISSVMGLEGNVCIRFGDVKIGYDVLQVCKGDYQPAAVSTPCAVNKWYHVAAVWSPTSLKIFIDGKFITETKTQGEKINISELQEWKGNGALGFALGAGSNYNLNRPLNGYLAEARVWTRALNASEIANIKDLVIVDPKSPDLLAYWKMNEAEPSSATFPVFSKYWRIKNKIVDQTGHGYDAYGMQDTPEFIDTVW